MAEITSVARFSWFFLETQALQVKGSHFELRPLELLPRCRFSSFHSSIRRHNKALEAKCQSASASDCPF
jgi:hypothetical protein